MAQSTIAVPPRFKFRVGERVRYNNPSSAVDGTLGVVVARYYRPTLKTNMYRIKFDACTFAFDFSEDRLEPFESPILNDA